MDKQDGIENELKELNSSLAGMSKNMPYQVPNGYFEDTDRRVLNRISAQTRIAYTTPENYFDQLPSAILNKVKDQNKTEEQKSTRISISWTNFKLAAAAAILLFFSIGVYQVTNNSIPSTIVTENKLAKVPDDMILAYVQDHIEEFDITMLEESSLTGNNTNLQQTINQIENNTITEYLNNTGW